MPELASRRGWPCITPLYFGVVEGGGELPA
jgi:hypothetical protein